MSEKLRGVLEEQQYKRLYWESDIPLRDIKAPLMRKLIYAALILFVLLCVMGVTIKFPDQVELPFVLRTDIKEEVYKYPYTVYLLEQYVAVGDSIKPGDALVRITSPEIVALINRYNETRVAKNNFDSSRHVAMLQQKNIIRAAIRENIAEQQNNEQQLKLANETWKAHQKDLEYEFKDATEKYNQFKKLYEGKAASKYEMIEKETRMLQAENALKQESLQYDKEFNRLKSSINQLAITNAASQNELVKSGVTYTADSIEMVNNYQLAAQDIINTFGNCEIKDGALSLKSSITGSVSFVFEGEKEISSGTTLLKLSKDNKVNFAFIKCSPAYAGKLHQSQVCHLKVYSYPFYEYGSVTGLVSEISVSADEKGEYNVYVVITDAGALKGKLQPGLTGTAVVVIEEKTLAQYFFRNISKHYYEFTEGKTDVSPGE